MMLKPPFAKNLFATESRDPTPSVLIVLASNVAGVSEGIDCVSAFKEGKDISKRAYTLNFRI